MTIKENLVEYMKKKGIQIKKLSAETGISEPTLKRLRTQENANPTLDVLIKISRSLDVTINDLIQNKKLPPVFYQGADNIFSITTNPDEFILVFTKNFFSFRSGSKAIFRKYTKKINTTKYILDNQGRLFEKINDEDSLFRDEKNNHYSIPKKSIFAVILKELYEVSYV